MQIVLRVVYDLNRTIIGRGLRARCVVIIGHAAKVIVIISTSPVTYRLSGLS